MKLYSSALCFGFLVFMKCQISGEAPKVIDTKCRENAYAVAKMLSLSEAEKQALPLKQKQANASILLKYRKDCKSG